MPISCIGGRDAYLTQEALNRPFLTSPMYTTLILLGATYIISGIAYRYFNRLGPTDKGFIGPFATILIRLCPIAAIMELILYISIRFFGDPDHLHFHSYFTVSSIEDGCIQEVYGFEFTSKILVNILLKLLLSYLIMFLSKERFGEYSENLHWIGSLPILYYLYCWAVSQFYDGRFFAPYLDGPVLVEVLYKLTLSVIFCFLVDLIHFSIIKAYLRGFFF